MSWRDQRVVCFLGAALATALCAVPVSPASAAGTECEDRPGCQLTHTELLSSPNPATSGHPVTYTAAITPIPDGGTVGFTDLGMPIAGCEAVPVNTSNGQATCTITYGAGGAHTIQASYSGDPTGEPNFKESASSLLTEVIEAPIVIPPATTTSVALSSSKNPAALSLAVTYTATIAPAPPGGTVEFTDSHISVASCRAVDVVKLSDQSATATCKVKYAAPGLHQMRAVYSGEGSFLNSESAALEQTVTGNTNELLAKLSRSPASRGSEVSMGLNCTSLAGSCRIKATLTTSVRLRGGKPVAVSANARARNVVVGLTTLTILSGKSAGLTVKLNVSGRRLLARFHKLPVKLTVSATSSGARSKVTGRKLTLTS